MANFQVCYGGKYRMDGRSRQIGDKRGSAYM